MDVIISNADSRPIYEQVYDQIKSAIISGKLTPGELLPSIRGLAKDLRISVITTKRAYDELEREGFIYTSQGRGCFVAEKNMELVRESRLREIEEHLRKALLLAPSCGMGERELAEMLRILSEEGDL